MFILFLLCLDLSPREKEKDWLERFTAGFHMITDDRKEICFHVIADDRKRSQSRLLHTFRTAEVSKLHAGCPREKIAANKMADVEGEILLQANLFFF